MVVISRIGPVAEFEEKQLATSQNWDCFNPEKYDLSFDGSGESRVFVESICLWPNLSVWHQTSTFDAEVSCLGSCLSFNLASWEFIARTKVLERVGSEGVARSHW